LGRPTELPRTFSWLRFLLAGFQLSNDSSQFILEEMGFFNVTRQADEVLKRGKNYVTEFHGHVVGNPASHKKVLLPNISPKTIIL